MTEENYLPSQLLVGGCYLTTDPRAITADYRGGTGPFSNQKWLGFRVLVQHRKPRKVHNE